MQLFDTMTCMIAMISYAASCKFLLVMSGA